jgi:GTPase
MQPEKEDGNVEYKLKLLDNSSSRIAKLASQMRYRCNEGFNECIYNLGVEDDGKKTGITDEDYKKTIFCIKSAAEKNNYSITCLTKTPINKIHNIYEILIRENNDNSYIELKVSIAGSVDCGKSTFLSVLTSGKKDDGRGSARISVFNYPHEVISGRTSSIGQQILGYDTEGKIVNYQGVRKLGWPAIVKRSSKIISFFDLAGHEKYLKTTIKGLSSASPDMCMIMVSANRGVLRMTKEHIFLCMALKIPFFIIITKIDLVIDKPDILKKTVSSIISIIKHPGVRRIPLKIKNESDIIRSSIHMHTETIVPIFFISNVTMDGMDKLKTFFNLTQKNKNLKKVSENVEYYIDESWNIPGIGTVIGGHLTSGEISVGDKLWIGPNNNEYTNISVKSIHCKRVPLQKVKYGSYVCLAVKGVNKKDIKKGNVILSKKEQHVLYQRILVHVEVIKTHSTTIKVGYQPILHASTIRTAVMVEKILNKVSGRNNKTDTDNILRSGDIADIILKFNTDKKFIKEDTSVILCEGRTKVVGYVKECY